MEPTNTSNGLGAKWAMGAPHLLSALRIVAAIMFFQSGTLKLFAWPIGMPEGIPPLETLSEGWWAGVLETFGGALILIGLFTRPVAFLLSGEMAIAYFQGHFVPNVHTPQGFWPIVNQGTDAVLYCFLFLYYSAAGAGPWSVDALRRK